MFCEKLVNVICSIFHMTWIGLNLKLYKSSENSIVRVPFIWTIYVDIHISHWIMSFNLNEVTIQMNYVVKMKIHIHRTTPAIQSPLSSAKIKWFQIDEHYTITFNSTKMCNTSTCSKMLYGTYKWAW